MIMIFVTVKIVMYYLLKQLIHIGNNHAVGRY